MHNLVACAVSRKHWQPAVRSKGFFGDSCFHTFGCSCSCPQFCCVLRVIHILHSTHVHVGTPKRLHIDIYIRIKAHAHPCTSGFNFLWSGLSSADLCCQLYRKCFVLCTALHNRSSYLIFQFSSLSVRNFTT